MNDSRDNQPESIEEQIVRLEIQKIRLETQLIEAGMRRDRVRLLHRRRPPRLALGSSVRCAAAPVAAPSPPCGEHGGPASTERAAIQEMPVGILLITP